MTDQTSGTAAQRPMAQWPWITCASIGVCIAIFLSVSGYFGSPLWMSLLSQTHLDAGAIWDGGYWSLITSAFVHFALWHLVFNVYWLWVLGKVMEQAIGSARLLLFVLLAAGLTSSYEIALTGISGIGMSGVVYAIFGFMWVTRRRYPIFARIVNRGVVILFLIWLVACIVMTRLGIMMIGNTAHVSGLLFGIAAR